MNDATISNHAANVIAEAIALEVPGSRVYVDERDSTALPHALIYVEASGPLGSVVYDGTLVVHIWAASYGQAVRLAEKANVPIVGFHMLADGSGYRVKRGGRSVLREDDAAHVTVRYPIRYDASN